MGCLGVLLCFFVLSYSGEAFSAENFLSSESSSFSGLYGSDSESSQQMSAYEEEEGEVTRLQRTLLACETENARLKQYNQQLRFCFASLKTLLVGDQQQEEREFERGNIVRCLVAASQVLKSLGERIEYNPLSGEDEQGDENQHAAAAAAGMHQKEYNEGKNVYELGTFLEKAAHRLGETVHDCDASLARWRGVRSISQYSSFSSLHSVPIGDEANAREDAAIEFSPVIYNPLFNNNNGSDLSDHESPLPEYAHSEGDEHIFESDNEEPLLSTASSDEEL